MPQLTPHLLLRSDAAASAVAIALRDAGYHVTKLKDDDVAVRTLDIVTIDAVVIELPVVATIGFLRRLAAAPAVPPLLALSVAPEVLRRAVPAIETYDIRDGLSHLTTATDLLIARGERRHAMRGEMRKVS